MLRSTWSMPTSPTRYDTAEATVAGSTPYSWMLRTVSSSPHEIRRSLLTSCSTRARADTISLTYSPAPYDRHSRR